jgi:hypothetical protein
MIPGAELIPGAEDASRGPAIGPRDTFLKPNDADYLAEAADFCGNLARIRSTQASTTF